MVATRMSVSPYCDLCRKGESVKLVAHFRITDLKTGQTRTVELGEPTTRLLGGQNGCWSLGAVGTGADIELEEPLEGASIGIFQGSNHVWLSGVCPRAQSLPEMTVLDYDNEWKLPDPREFQESGDTVYLRFDERPLTIGTHLIEMERIRG